MIIKISNKDIQRYRYTRRKIEIKERKMKKNKISFGEIFSNIQHLKEKGIISISNVNISISNSVKNNK